MADIVNKAIQVNGKIPLGPGGIARVLPHPLAPNGVNLGETVEITASGTDNERNVTITFPTADYSAYRQVIFYFIAVDGDGNQINSTFAMTPASGAFTARESQILGALTGYNPRYQMVIIDTSNRVGYSRGLLPVLFDHFQVITPPALSGTFIEGSEMSVIGATTSGGGVFTIASEFRVATDDSGTDAQTQVVTDNETPDITGDFRFISYRETFTGDASGLPFTSDSEWYEIIDFVAPPVEKPVYLGGLETLNLESGQAFTIDWDTYFSGATSYQVVSGLTGGISSNGSSTNDVYTVASLTSESIIFSVTASNSAGTTNRAFNVVVTTPGIAPGLASAVPDFVVPRGSTIDYNVAQHFAGTTLTYFSVEDDSNFALNSSGRYRSLVPLTSAIASANKVFVAYNTIGTTLGSNPITTTNASSSVVVAWSGHTIVANDWVGITGASAVGGITLNGAYKVVSVVAGTSVTINARTNASSSATGGGAAVKAQEAAWDTVAVEVTQTPNAALTVTEADTKKSNFRYGSTWRAPEVRLPAGILLATNPIATTSGSATVRVTLADHKLVNTDTVVLTGATAVGGLTLSGTYTVNGVIDTNTFTINAVSTASSTATGGGSVVVYTRPQTSTTLGNNPFTFVNGSSTVIVTWTAHPVGVGRVVEFSGATIAANLIISGAYLVVSSLTANTFTIDAGSLANASTSGGGAAVVATLRNHNQPLTFSSNPLTTTNGSAVVTVAAPNHMMAIGRPITLADFATTGGISAGNINGSRTVLAVVDANNFTFTAGAVASSAVGGGGSAGRIQPTWYDKKWTRTTPDSNGVVPDAQSEEGALAWQATTYGRWEPHMELVGNEGDPTSQSPRLNYSVWGPESPAQFRFAYKETPTSLWSTWSGQVPVPAIELPVVAGSWLPLSSRNKNSYEADDPESRGQQFERVVVPYRGTNSDRRDWWFAGQDENSGWISKDDGYTWKGINIPGMTCSEMSGAYMDDDCAVFVGDAFAKGGWAQQIDFAGLFVGPPDLSSSTRLELTRAEGTQGPSLSGGTSTTGPRKAFVAVQHGGSYRGAQNCVDRRPQTGGLTLAQRPIWVVEQQLPNTGGTVLAVYVWKIILSGVGTVASATMVRTIAAATLGSGSVCVKFVKVAPNGNVMLVCQNGIFVSTDDFATAPVQKASYECNQGHFFGGSASTSSGAYIGRADSTGGVYATSNINTTAFARPTGAGGAANAGLPSAFAVVGLGMGPDGVLVTHSGGKGVWKSVDGAKNWSSVSQVTRPPSTTESWRSGVGAEPSAVYASQNTAGIWVIHAAQMLLRSTNNFQTMDPKGTIYCDGVHDKGWAFSETSPLKMARMAQDNWANTSLDGVNWMQRNDQTSSGNSTLRNAIQAAGGGSAGLGYITAAQGLFVESNNRVIGAITNDGASFPCVIFQITGRTGTYGQYASSSIISPSGSSSVCQRADWSPLLDGRGFLGRWCISNAGAASAVDIDLLDHSGREFIGAAASGRNITLGNNPLTTTNGSAIVTVAATAHGMLAEQAFTLNGAVAVGGISAGNLNGARTIVSASTNSFTFTAAANASSGATGGGASVTTTKACVSFWGNHSYTSGTTVYRSIQPDGSSHVLWYTFPPSYIARSMEIDRFHPTLNRLIYSPTTSKQTIRQAVKVGSTVTISDLVNLYTMTDGVEDIMQGVLGGAYDIPPWEVLGVLSDYHRAGLFYVYGGHHGHPNWFMTTDDGDTWESISEGTPSTQWRGRVSPLTGDLIGSSSLGGYVFPPISDYPAITYRGLYSSQLKAFYDKSTVPNPPN